MTTLQTSFELAPAGTAIPTTGVPGDGDAFSAGNDGTATFVSDTTAAALAAGSYCGNMSTVAASVCHRSWNLTTSTPAVRMYLYLTAYPNSTTDIASPVSSGTLLSRIRLSTTGQVYITLAGTNQTNSTGTIPLNTLVRLEADWSLSTTAGTCSVDAYAGHSTTPLSNLSISATGMAMASATCSSFRLGMLATGPTNFTMLTDGWGVADTGRLGPLGSSGLQPPTGLTATPVSSSQIDLSWTAASGATGYDIERDGTIIVTNQAGTTYSDTGRAASTLYSYRVRSVG